MNCFSEFIYMYNGPHSSMKQQIVYKSLILVSTGVTCCFWGCLLTKFQFLTNSCLLISWDKPDIHKLHLCCGIFQWRNDIESSRLDCLNSPQDYIDTKRWWPMIILDWQQHGIGDKYNSIMLANKKKLKRKTNLSTRSSVFLW